MPEDALCSDLITRSFLTSAQLAASGPKVNLSVRYRGNVMWSIPVEECQTWFDFISHFRDFWPCRLSFFWHKRQVTPEDWPKIMHLPHRINNRITLDLQFRYGNSIQLDKLLTNHNVSKFVNAPKSRFLHPTEREKSQADKDKSNSAKLQSSHKESGTPTDQHRKLPPGNVQTPKESNQNTEVTKLSILTRLDGVAQPNNSIDEVMLEDHMEKVEDFLIHRTSFTDSRAYKSCSSLLRTDVHSMLENEGKELLNSDTPTEKLKVHEDIIDIFNTADSLFQFFLPMTSKTPTAMKFWGAVHRIVCGKRKTSSNDGKSETRDFELLPSRSLKHVLDTLKPVAVRLTAWSDLLSHAKASDHTRIKAPNEFLQAWLHLLMGFIYLSKENHHRSYDFISSAETLIDRGLKTIIQSLSKRNLLESSVVLPLELVSLMSLKLLQSITPGHPDITKTYSSYIDSIEADIVMKPSDRSHEKRLMQLKHEISTIRKIMDSQRSIFDKLKEYNSTTSSRSPNHRSDEPQIVTYDPISGTRHLSRTSRTTRVEDSRVHPSYRRDCYDTMKQEPAYTMDPPTNFKLKSTDAGGYRHLLLQECTMLIYSQDINFMDFDFQVSQAEGIVSITNLHPNSFILFTIPIHLTRKQNRNKIDTTKDRQEQAIYAFTIVTIIFLPLSAVASIFGMNTNDVRNMDFGQWIYWAVAIPVTVVVICLGLLWTGELGNILEWILSFKAGQRRFAYEPIRADERIPRRARNYEEMYPLPQFEYPERTYTRRYRE
ncbi:mg2+ transporter protein [Rutstroemia sp. NJR-2017a BVV2]|nr:mg2+ transporter protein [Rutstroemia sp. NJR-2017a BVV2]